MNLSEPLIRHKLSVTDYYRMGEAGILHEDDRIELIEGELIDMAPIGSNHAGIVNQLTWLLSSLAGRYALVSPQNPLLLSGHTVPQPDILLLKPRPDFYKTALPEPADVLLLIEVADSSISYDRKTKLPLYARHGIPEVWLVDLNAKQVERYSQPTETGYGLQETFDSQQTLTSFMMPKINIDLTQLFS